MSLYKYLILSTLVLLCSICCVAQDDNYVYRDSALLYGDSVNKAAAQAENSSNYRTRENIGDTILVDNQLFVEPDSIRVLKNSKPFYYARHLDSLLNEYRQNLEKDQASAKTQVSWLGRFFLSPLTKYFFWILAVAFVSFILYKLFFTEGFFQRSYASINVTRLPEEDDEHSSKNMDYGGLVKKAVSTRNYRLAVRYHYLQSLQKLASKGVIQFTTDKTNYQYLRELSGKSYKNAFASLTLDYEYVWYGGFEINEVIFDSIQNKFKQFNSGV